MSRKRLVPIVVVIFLISFLNVFFGISRVESKSMMPTLNDGDWLLFLRFSNPEKFGIFFVDDPKNENIKLVKRIVGLPGEKIEEIYNSYTIPANHYYVLGDFKGSYWNKELGEMVVSLDSRDFGPVRGEKIHERVILVFLPFSHARWVW
ncbi:MAG TPA: signal peptidase I [Candidatus Paceibacterota bacterium]